MKLVIAGSRSISEKRLRALDLQALLNFCNIPWPKEFIHGGCPKGVDKWAHEAADTYWDISPTKVFMAEWEKYGTRAGPIRNKKMAVYGDALLLIWDGKSAGSKSMKEAMMALKKPIYEIVLNSYNEPDESKEPTKDNS